MHNYTAVGVLRRTAKDSPNVLSLCRVLRHLVGQHTEQRHVSGGNLASDRDAAKGTIMNKLVKGSIAGAAGVALLLGGAGTLALWNDSASINAGTVASGVLDVANDAAGSWSPSLSLIVPGDTIVYTDALEVTATGDNLKATVTTNIGSITNNITGAVVTSDITVTDSLGDEVVPVLGEYTLNTGDGSYTVDVVLTVEFPETVSGQTGQDRSTDFSDITVSVTQVV
jgi:alternate signal-mediated exported protein